MHFISRNATNDMIASFVYDLASPVYNTTWRKCEYKAYLNVTVARTEPK